MRRHLLVLPLIAALTACSFIKQPAPTPTPTPTPTVTPAPQIAILTVEVEPKNAVVEVRFGSRAGLSDGIGVWSTRPDGTIVEEFRAGQFLTITARSTGHKESAPVEVVATAGLMSRVRIVLEKLPPAPTPTPTPGPIEIVNGKLPAAVVTTIRQFASVFPIPQGDGSEGWMDVALRKPPSGWMHRLAQQLAFSYGPSFGHKRRGPGAALSAGSFAVSAPGGMHVWDILLSTGDGKPKLDGSFGQYYWVTDQEFVSVQPYDHFSTVAPPTDRPTIQGQIWGVSGFDLAARVDMGDRRFYDLTDGLVVNVFVYATIDHPQTHRVYRDFATGLRQTETLLKQLVLDGRTAHFILLCGTGIDGHSRAQALEMLRQENALLLRYPSAVVAVSLGNELFQSFEASYMTDPTFWAEGAAIIDRRFPFAVGVVGDDVAFGPGSFAAHHSDRGLDPDTATKRLADAQLAGFRVIDREPRRIEQGGSGQSTGDLDFVLGLIAAAKKYKISSFLHIAAGRGADVDALDDVQRKALELYKAEAQRQTQAATKATPYRQEDEDDREWLKAA